MTEIMSSRPRRQYLLGTLLRRHGDPAVLRIGPGLGRVAKALIDQPTWLVAVAAALPALLAWAVLGPLQVVDSRGYLDYAAALRTGTVATGSSLLRQTDVPVTLFRMGGYPALLAMLQAALPRWWCSALVLLQIGAQALVASGSFRAARNLGVRLNFAVVAALLPAFGFVLVLQLCVLTDALYSAMITGAALLLLREGPRPRLAAVVLLVTATAFREATLFMAIFYIPLALYKSPFCQAENRSFRLSTVALIMLGPCTVAAAQLGWNVSRGAGPVITTSPQTVMVQAVLPLLRAGLPVYDGDDVFDREARATVGAAGSYAQIESLHKRLFAAGMTAPEMSALATRRYWKTWHRFPLAMATATLRNFRPKYLTTPLQPLETIGDLAIFAGGSRPEFTQINREWAHLLAGELRAALWVVIDALTKLVGTAIALMAIVGPWLRPGAWRLRALWCVASGLVLIYLPVHLEPRYFTPIVPLVCLLAAASRAPRSAQHS